ncbi:connective tissue growth factor, partial [Mytilus galloprovincialis]
IASECPRVCDCPHKQLNCEYGVPRVIDGCGCCHMCARQYGDTCSAVDRCDTDKGLYCDHLPNAQHGICKANTPKGCEINGKKYNDGDTFYLNNNCRNRCTCQNGHYGCVDLCPQEYTKPSMIFCPNAELMPVRGQCCKEWSCLKPNKTESNKIPRHIANNYKLRPQNNPTW